MKKAYCYLRVSSQNQIDGYGFDRQEEAIRAYAIKTGYEVVGVFKEEGVSGAADETHRPAFEAMLTEILKDGVKTVLIERLDRLARDLLIQLTMLAFLERKGVELIDVGTGMNVIEAMKDDPMKKALIQIQASFAELEKSLIVRRLRAGREKARMERGKCEGAPGYGETDGEKRVVTRMKLMRRRKKGGFRGMTYQQVAETLNAEGIEAKRGGRWTKSQVYQVVNRK
jgi:DNA invertase Pin-like site-specific DNA recombinase